MSETSSNTSVDQKENDKPKSRSRRRFLTALGVVGGGLVIGVPLLRQPTPSIPYAQDAEFSPDAFLQVTANNEIHFYVPRAEMGQGINHGLTTLIAEELNIQPEAIIVHHAGAHKAYNNPGMNMQITGGSMSMATSYLPLRQAAANAREALHQAAARELGVPASTLELRDGWVQSTGNRQPYGDFASSAAAVPVPENAALKSPDEFRFIGRDEPRIDALAKSTGTAEFGIDVDFDGLKRAAVVRSPVFGGTVETYDPSTALEMPGVLQVVELPAGIAVVADSYWQARKAAEKMEVEWAMPDLAAYDTQRVMDELKAAAHQTDSEEAFLLGDPESAIALSEKTLEADYYSPYMAHATMEPMNCTARFNSDGRCEIWAPTQAAGVVQGLVAFHTGLDLADIDVHVTYMGGGFGRRGNADYAVEAVQIAQRTGVPVQVIWSREDDMQHDYYRPASYARLQAGLGADGTIQSWRAQRAGPNIIDYMIKDMAGAIAPAALPDGLVRWMGGKSHWLFDSLTVDPTSVEGLHEDYDFDHVEIRHVTVDPGLRTGFWRAPGHCFSGFAKECFMDELATTAGSNPMDFRLKHLSADSPQRRALEWLRDEGGWGSVSSAGAVQGLAVHRSFGSTVGQIVEASVDGTTIKVHKVTCVVDCGLAVNPQIVAQQMESSIVYGLTAALYSRIDLRDGKIVQSNFHDYPMLRLSESPEIVTHILPSNASPKGVGEPGLPPLAAALGNAIFAATGQRLRQLPFAL